MRRTNSGLANPPTSATFVPTNANIGAVLLDPAMPGLAFLTQADGILLPIIRESVNQRFWVPDGNGTSIAKTGGPNASAVGTITSDGTAAITSYRTAVGNIVKIPSAAIAASFSELRSGDSREIIGGVAGVGGAYVRIKFGIDTLASAADRFFAGYLAAGGAPANTDPSTWINMFGVAADAADVNYQFMCNDGAGLATKTDLGANYPKAANNNIYLLELYWPPNSSTIAWRVSRLDDKTKAAQAGSAAANTPAATVLGWHVWQSNNATAAACGVLFGGITIEPIE